MRTPRVITQAARKSPKIKVENNTDISESVCDEDERHIPSSPQILNKKRMVHFETL
jgi:hypothetical protein